MERADFEYYIYIYIYLGQICVLMVAIVLGEKSTWTQPGTAPNFPL